jgi:hypothetical protein
VIPSAVRRAINLEFGIGHPEAVLRGLAEDERVFVGLGFPPMSPWWADTIRQWYGSNKRQIVARVGRRGGKSSSLCRLAVAEARHGLHKVPPGDTGVVAIVSADRRDAQARLKTIMSLLDALGEAYKPDGDGAIVLQDRPVGFRVFTGSISGVSGFTGIFVFCDEVSKWKDRDTGANPATEVLASIRPTMATMPNARIVLSSSPMGHHDAHYDAFEAGDTGFQMVAYAPTWEANPTLTEADTRTLEEEEVVWQREYAAVPQADSEQTLIPATVVNGSVRVQPAELEHKDGSMYVATMDPATRGNAWTLILARRELDVRRVCLARQWMGSRDCPLSPKAVLEEIAAILLPYGVRRVYSDQFAGDALVDIGRDTGLHIELAPWSQSSRREALEEMRSLFLASRIEIPDDADVISDILSVQRVLTRAGSGHALRKRGARHADYAMSLAMAVQAARWPGREDLPTQTLQERHRQAKRRFLEGRQREKDKAEQAFRLAPHPSLRPE